jgi:hypothetical protein
MHHQLKDLYYILRYYGIRNKLYVCDKGAILFQVCKIKEDVNDKKNLKTHFTLLKRPKSKVSDYLDLFDKSLTENLIDNLDRILWARDCILNNMNRLTRWWVKY